MYFEDIFEMIKPLWKKNFSLSGLEKSKTYIVDVRSNYIEIEKFIDGNEIYNEWHSVLVFSMYQAITYFGISEWQNDKLDSINTDDISLRYFELFFLRNLEPIDEDDEGNIEFLDSYKGFKI